MLLKTKIEIKKWLNHYGVKSYELIDDEEYGYVVNVDNNVYLDNLGLQNIGVKFSKVDGHFYCNNNQLKKLKGCPEIVNGTFNCSNNNLTSLEGCPRIVNNRVYVHNNKLKIEELKFLPEEIKSNYIDVDGNINLYNLERITDFKELKVNLNKNKIKNKI